MSRLLRKKRDIFRKIFYRSLDKHELGAMRALQILEHLVNGSKHLTHSYTCAIDYQAKKLANNSLGLLLGLFIGKNTDSFVFIMVTFESFQNTFCKDSQARHSTPELIDYKHF